MSCTDISWKNFALEMGANSEEIENVKHESFTKDLIDNFFKQGRSSYAEGLASLYTYERQIPEIAETKIQGLKNHYGCSSKKGLEFFEAHKSASLFSSSCKFSKRIFLFSISSQIEWVALIYLGNALTCW